MDIKDCSTKYWNRIIIGHKITLSHTYIKFIYDFNFSENKKRVNKICKISIGIWNNVEKKLTLFEYNNEYFPLNNISKEKLFDDIKSGSFQHDTIKIRFRNAYRFEKITSKQAYDELTLCMNSPEIKDYVQQDIPSLIKHKFFKLYGI